MPEPPDEIKRQEKQRFRIRCINVAWMVFIFSPLIIFWVLWLPTGISQLLAGLQFLKSYFK